MNTTTKQAAIETRLTDYTLTLTFANGKEMTVNIASLSADIARAATLHGLKQKLCDAGAIARDPETGRTATIDTKYQAVKEVFDRITSTDGTWNKQREAGSTGGLLTTALIRMYAGRKTKEQVLEYLSLRTPAEQAALRKVKRIAELIEEIKAERAANAGNDDEAEQLGEDLLSELDD